MTAQNSAEASTFFASSIAVSDAAPLLPMSGLSPWGVSVFSVSGDFCCWWCRSVKSGGFVISFSGSYVLWRFISPCDCDSDERLDCFWSPVVVARRLSWRTLCIIFKSLPSSIISFAINVRTFRVSCWEPEKVC